ncbi:uncharacterized protein LOC111274304 [Durio zibethinus]|uniref:Uncharacterized protein LOC111274304 n=1 Tax=Durio zibethinus TaxID=66656 RepID=A0A6P5WEZ9_DURZI|nr:uncharacterized protein LOC111274304 [Durio zibethinus]
MAIKTQELIVTVPCRRHLLPFFADASTSFGHDHCYLLSLLTFTVMICQWHICSSTSTISTRDKTTTNPEYAKWIKQDKLILYAIIASSGETVVLMTAASKTSYGAMTRLTNLFASKTRSRVMYFKKKLSLSTQGNKPVAEFMPVMKSIADELALAQAPATEDNLIIFILNGLGMQFREISTAIRARESAISLEELHDKLTNFEAVIKQEKLITTPVITTNMVRKGKRYEQQQKGNNP